MSDTVDYIAPIDPETPTETRSIEPPVPFQAFAATLRPPLRRDPASGQVLGVAGPGHADEIWLRWIGRMHGRERHTLAEWSALIDGYRDEPAHPSVLGTR